MNKQLLASLMLAAAAALTGCGSGGGSSPTPPPDDGGNNTPPPPPAPPGKVAGPMDAVQEPMSEQVVGPMIAAFSGTPIAPVLVCMDQIVVNDAIDIADAMALGVQTSTASGDPATAFAAMADEVQGQLQLIVADLQGLLAGLAGNQFACQLPTTIGSNPLAGTPLAAVGEQLAPVLTLVNEQVTGGTPSLTALASTFAQLNAAVATAFDAVPAEVSGAPVIGAALAAIEQALANANAVVVAAMSQDNAAVTAAVQTTVQEAVFALVLQVVPIQDIEAGAGQPGVISGPLAEAIAQFAAVIGTDLGPVQQAVLEARLSDALAEVTGPLEDGVLNMVLPAIDDIVTGVPVGLPEMVELTEVIDGLDETLGTSSVFDDIIGAECPFADTVLASLCSA